jgi:hypothetical protein
LKREAPGTADLDLVLALIKPADWLKARATAHVAARERLVVPYSVAIELLFLAREQGVGSLVGALGATEAHFELERRDVLYTAAEALDSGELATVFDAVHAADALHRGAALHTTDARLRGSSFPTVGF